MEANRAYCFELEEMGDVFGIQRLQLDYEREWVSLTLKFLTEREDCGDFLKELSCERSNSVYDEEQNLLSGIKEHKFS